LLPFGRQVSIEIVSQGGLEGPKTQAAPFHCHWPDVLLKSVNGS
jgi:hypothetical protein